MKNSQKIAEFAQLGDSVLRQQAQHVDDVTSTSILQVINTMFTALAML